MTLRGKDPLRNVARIQKKMACSSRCGIQTLVVTLILLAFTASLGLMFGTGLYDRVVQYMGVIEGELLTINAIHRDDILWVRANFKHILGTSMDRIAVSEFLVGGARMELTNDIVPEHVHLEYRAEGWRPHTGSPCTNWVVEERVWPTGGTFPPRTPPACTIDLYQRIDDGDARQDVLSLSDGSVAVLEFVMVGVGKPDGRQGAMVVQYGLGEQTKFTGDSGVSIYHKVP